MGEILTTITRLKEKHEQLFPRSVFHQPASNEEIMELEISINLALPDDLRMFYLTFDGGYFADALVSEKSLDNYLLRSSNEWQSNSFLSLADIIYYYHHNEEYAFINFKELEKLTGRRLIPILHTKNQKFFIWDATDSSGTPILFAAENESDEIELELVYHSFEDFICDYITREGKIEPH